MIEKKFVLDFFDRGSERRVFLLRETNSRWIMKNFSLSSSVKSVCFPVEVSFTDQLIIFLNGNVTTGPINSVWNLLRVTSARGGLLKTTYVTRDISVIWVLYDTIGAACQRNINWPHRDFDSRSNQVI